MNRRQFTTSLLAAGLWGKLATSAEIPPDLKITRAVGFDLHTTRPKYVGRNANRGENGRKSYEKMVRLWTNVGVEAIGRCWRPEKDLAQIVGTNPFADFDLSSRRIESPLGPRTMILWDLLGRLLNKPVYQLLGDAKSDRTPVYDGSIYFSDLIPKHANRWQDRFREEIDLSLDMGHRFFKLKVGRGHKWMKGEAGHRRDIEVVKLVREHAGEKVGIGVDANNTFGPDHARRFLKETADCKLDFLEEPFPEKVEPCVALKEFIKDEGLNTLLADGEGTSHVEQFRPLVEAKAVDVLQGDMYGLGIEGIMAESALAAPAGIQIAPHNWSSLLSIYMQAHVGLVLPNFYRAEHDPLSSDLLIADGYEIKDGHITVPDAPGFGLRLDEKRFANAKVNFDLRA
ncbi:enolase C-terminal domain-like protein [Stratiformator vulcanicus]|uniref:Starvation-sensing protein RspA n=1 Tax=Stratiformator vulcanicus TaxID=2527980 RepID=A0A517R6G9_9PLAN|nr:enolase C-terminal domain-like protein [Stratiformator vulcanicus]QDT39479.1 Starvation-sensing protein RspA [Stratiformator vulcanicus]